MTRTRASALVVVALSVAAGLVAATALGREGASVVAVPPGSATPATLVDAVRQMAVARGGDAGHAMRTLQRLRTASRQGEALYSFEVAPGAACLIVWKRSSTCSVADSSDSSVTFMVSGGYPAWATPDGEAVPSILTGVAPDVVAVMLKDGEGTNRVLSIENDAFAVELDDTLRGSIGALTVEYASGRRETIRVPLR